MRKAVTAVLTSVGLLWFLAGSAAGTDEDGYQYRIGFTVPAEQRVLMQRVVPANGAPKSLIEQVGTFFNHPVANPNSGNPGIRAEALPPTHRYWARFSRAQYVAAVESPRISASEVPGVHAATVDPCQLHNSAAHTTPQAWDNAYELIANYGACSGAHILDSADSPAAASLHVIEPRLATPDKKAIPPPVVRATVAWPWPGRSFWHRESDYAGLDAALTTMQQSVNMQDPAVKRVRIAHLDTGYPDPQQFAKYPWPPNFLTAASADCYEPSQRQPSVDGCDVAASTPGAGVDRSLGESALINSYLHGAGTLSILAGGFIDDPAQKCARGDVPHYGGNPCAEVFEVRIGPSFVHFDEESMALGIRQAVEGQADVISLSHGGFPASILADAVDDAYNNGTAIFAATGDYFGPFTPKTVVFPARYAQVMGVAAATSDYKSAGVRACWLCLFKFFGGGGFIHNFTEWLVGTNYGPASIMKGHVVAGYSPNITYYDAHPPIGLSDDENGTSASTPQAAAAASMWLQVRRGKIEGDVLPDGNRSWRSWQKTEAVYQAVMQGVVVHPLAGRSSEELREYYRLYFGAGLLSAPGVLAVDYLRPDDCLKRAHSRADLFWIVDALGSIGIFDVLPLYRGRAAVRDVAAAFHEAVRTELMQAANRSAKLTDVLAGMGDQAGEGQCESSSGNLSKISQKSWQSLRKLVLADAKASNTLKTTVTLLASRGTQAQ
jgi:hypothetical protein